MIRILLLVLHISWMVCFVELDPVQTGVGIPVC